MKYESSILKRLIDTYGVIGNPRYLSEIIKEFIVRGKELYPQLFTYQSDWLAHIDEFGLTPEYTVSYTGQHIYAPNTKEKPVKRAILKGNTERINEHGFYQSDNSIFHLGYFEQGTYGGNIGNANKKTDSVTRIRSINSYKVPQGTYSVELNSGFEGAIRGINDSNEVLFATEWSSSPTTSVTNDTTLLSVVLRKQNQASISVNDLEAAYKSSSGFDFANVTLTNVKMPVLTTTGKNLFDMGKDTNHCWQGITEFVDGRIKVTSTHNNGVTFHSTYNIPVKKGRTYHVNVNREGNGDWHLWKNGDSTKPLSNPFTVDDTFDSVAIGLYCAIGEGNVCYFKPQIEEGSTATTYEPYKSNILTTPEDLELRGIGDVQDTLDCLTGEVTERIGEIVLDGSEPFTLQTINTQNHTRVSMTLSNSDASIGGVCNKLRVRTTEPHGEYEYVYIQKNVGGVSLSNLFIQVENSKLTTPTLKGVKTYLQTLYDSGTPLIIQYGKGTESVKTVDLTIHDKDHQKVERLTSFEGGTHFTTSSQDGSLLPTLTVDVVTDLEKTMMVCSLEGNTM